jgi:hypothetical protein
MPTKKSCKRHITKRKIAKRSGEHAHKGTGVKTYDSLADINVR